MDDVVKPGGLFSVYDGLWEYRVVESIHLDLRQIRAYCNRINQ